MKYMICYDVPDDKCRRKIVKFLEAIGRRIQYVGRFIMASLYLQTCRKVCGDGMANTVGELG